MQISPQSRGSSSKPIGQSATIAVGWRMRAHPRLDHPEMGQPEPFLVLRLAHHQAAAEAMLSDAAADRSRELTGLQVRHPHVAVELGGPPWRVRVDAELQRAVGDLVRRPRWRARELQCGV